MGIWLPRRCIFIDQNDPPCRGAMGRGTAREASGGGAATAALKPLRQPFGLPPPHRFATGRIDSQSRSSATKSRAIGERGAPRPEERRGGKEGGKQCKSGGTAEPQ